MTRYYVMPRDAAGQRVVIPGPEGQPVNMTGVDVVDLPHGDWFRIAGKGQNPYPALRVARAVLAGQVSVDDLTAVTE